MSPLEATTANVEECCEVTILIRPRFVDEVWEREIEQPSSKRGSSHKVTKTHGDNGSVGNPSSS
jgi:hypothetical protein